jgi:hypothetical protein
MKSSWRIRPLATLFCALTFLVSAGASSQGMEGFDPKAKAVPDFNLTPFYETNLEHVGKKPGEVIRAEAIRAPEGALAWRVMYVSRTWDDRLVPVTGMVVAPKEAGSKVRPVLNWLHGTTGGSRICAPSLAENPAQDLVQRSPTAPIDYGIPYLTAFLRRGFVVVATDYYGRKTTDRHSRAGLHHGSFPGVSRDEGAILFRGLESGNEKSPGTERAGQSQIAGPHPGRARDP